MASVIQVPDALSLSGNLKSFILSSSSEVAFALKKGATVILSETYYPDSNNRVEIQVKDVVSKYLETNLPAGNAFSQTGMFADFTALADDAQIASFRAFNAGVRNLSTSASQFLAANWLTWQPQTKRTTWNTPEYLTYYFTQAARVKAKFYLKSGTTKTVQVSSGNGGAALTFNMMCSYLFGLSGENTSDLYGIVDVWVETSGGSRLSYIQRYICDEPQGDEHVYLCVNSLGGIDTYIFHGACSLAPDIEHESAENGEERINITSGAERRWEQTTGYASMAETSWIFELVAAEHQWAVMQGSAEAIVIDSSSLRVSDRNNLHSCSFAFKLVAGGRLLNITRSDSALPAVEVPSPSGEIFFLALRLSDYPDSDLAGNSLLLLQSPVSDTWFKASLGAISDMITQTVLASMPAPANRTLTLQIGSMDGAPDRSFNGQSDVTARIPSQIRHLTDRNTVPYLGAMGANNLVQLLDSAGNSIYPALREGSFWGNSWNGGAVAGPLTFTASTAASATADLEVIVRNNVRYLHTRLPFYSDSSVSSGGISTGGSASGAGSSVVWGTSSNEGHELLTVDDYQPRDVSLHGHTHTFASLDSKPNTLSGYGITDGVNSLTVSGTGNAITSASLSGHKLTLTKGSTFQSVVDVLGSATKPVYVSSTGVFAECSTYAGGTRVTLNGTDKGASTASFYAPASAGSSGQYLRSSGSGAPSWASPGSIASGNSYLVTGSAVYNYALQKTARGNTGVPVFVNASGETEVIKYLNVGTEQGSIILPFFSNDIAFLSKRGGSCTISGDYSGTPDLSAMFNGKPDYCFIDPTSTNGTITLTIKLPTDEAFTYSEYLYIDFGSNSWRADNITVKCYRAPHSTLTEESSPYKTISDTCSGPFWVGGNLSVADGYRLTKLIIELSGFTATGLLRISEIGLQKYSSNGLSASYMSRGSNDSLWRDLVPSASITYNLGDADHLWDNIYVRYARPTVLYTGSIYAKDNASTLSLYTGNASKAFEFGTSYNYSYRSLLPSSNNALDLGTGSVQWRWAALSQGVRLQNKNVIAYNQSTWGDGNVHTTLLIGNGFTGTNSHTSIYGENIDFYPTGSSLKLRINDSAIKVDTTLQPYTHNTVDLGSSEQMWKDIFVMKIRPTTSTATGYPNLTYDSANSRWVLTGNIYISGNMIAAGAVASGATSNGSSDFPVAVGGSITPNVPSGYDLGSPDYRFHTLYANYIGDEDVRVVDGYFSNIDADNIVTGTLHAASLDVTNPPYVTTWSGLGSVASSGSASSGTLASIGGTESDLLKIVAGKITTINGGGKYQDTSTTLVFSIVTVSCTKTSYGGGTTIVYDAYLYLDGPYKRRLRVYNSSSTPSVYNYSLSTSW